ncbi:MAG: hypothetical protein KFW21_03780 [Spirochaetota bacterium]|nr:hypothetical protein [Spirochaetota bacterium]
MKINIDDILHQMTDFYVNEIHKKKELQKFKIINFVENNMYIIALMLALGIAIFTVSVVLVILIILLNIPLEILW